MKQYITFLFCFFTLIGFSQDKRVHLVHGLGGDSDSWGEFRSDLEKECDGLDVTTFFNPSNAGLDFYSLGLRNDFEDYGINAQDVAIGHSFGGLNLRNLDSEGFYKGYITVGSVHDGSPLADSKLDGSFDTWLDNTCKEVFTQPVVAIQELSLLSIAPDLFNGYFEDMFCNKINEILTENADAFVGGGQSVQDLIDDGYIANLPGASIPAIGIVCTTEGHPLWTLLDEGDFINIPLGGTFKGVAEKIEKTGKASSNLLRILSNLTFNPFLKGRLRTASRECKESYLWMQSTESAWNELIGAGGEVSYSSVTTETWLCDCYDINTSQPVPCTSLDIDIELIPLDVDPAVTCSSDPDCWSFTNSTVAIFGPDLPSDGLIPQNRQSLAGSIHEELITNASHFDEPKNDGVKSTLFQNLSPNTAINSIFKIPTCP